MILAPGRNVVLIGMMGAGKTVVGRLLAARLQRPFIDTDAIVEAEAGATIARLFATRGERAFRAREAEAVRWVSALRGQVIAVGGGAILDPANVTALRATGDLVLLHAEPAELAKRLATCDNRPLLVGSDDLEERLVQLRRRRGSAYRRAAAHAVDTTRRTPEEVATAVLTWARTQPGLLTRDERE
ncbi:MAG: shikimate kinase [Egibacteraceae bacterium]